MRKITNQFGVHPGTSGAHMLTISPWCRIFGIVIFRRLLFIRDIGRVYVLN